MSSRRPRVPRSALSRAAASVPAGEAEVTPTAESHPVTRHSAKVIPLDPTGSRPAARQRPAERRPSPEQRRLAERRAVTQRPARSHTASSVPTTSDAPRGEAAAKAPAATKPATKLAATAAPTARGGGVSTAPGRTVSTQRPARPGIPATHGSTEAVAKAMRAQQAPVQPVPARSFSGRTIALLVVAMVAAILVAPTLRVFLNQQAELSTVSAEIEQQQDLQGELTSQIKRWEDPAYIQQQARERLNLVMPGEKKYMVIGGEAALEGTESTASDPSTVNPEMPWADGLWDSVVRAATD